MAYSFTHKVGLALAALFVTAVLILASSTTVSAGQVMVIHRFGNPIRVLTEPGFHWHLPVPIETAHAVDCRLHTTPSGQHTVQVGDGSMFIVEAAVLWRVPQDADRVRQFLRSIDNKPNAMAQQLRSLTGSALQTIAGQYHLEDLLNVEQVRIEEFENHLAQTIRKQSTSTYGIQVDDVFIERFLVPEAMHKATLAAMIKEREVLAEQRRSQGLQEAGTILAEAKSDARQIIAAAKTEAAQTIARAQEQAASEQASIYQQDPELYQFLRELMVLSETLGKRTTLILRTDTGPLLHLRETSTPAAPPVSTLRPQGSQTPVSNMP